MEDEKLDRILNAPEPKVIVNRDGSCTPVAENSEKLRELIAKWPHEDSVGFWEPGANTVAHKKEECHRCQVEATLADTGAIESEQAETTAMQVRDILWAKARLGPEFAWAGTLGDRLDAERFQPTIALARPATAKQEEDGIRADHFEIATDGGSLGEQETSAPLPVPSGSGRRKRSYWAGEPKSVPPLASTDFDPQAEYEQWCEEDGETGCMSLDIFTGGARAYKRFIKRAASGEPTRGVPVCTHCGKPESDSKHIRYGNDADNPVKHEFAAQAQPAPRRRNKYGRK